MEQVIQNTIRGLPLGEARAFGMLTVWPLISREAPGDRPGYVTLDEALRRGKFRVTEVGDAGRVPELRVVNDGDRPVLLLDGEELVGAKQNRILNVTVLAPGGKEIVIPVSCVEAGRWAMRGSVRFASSPQVMYSKVRGAKAMQVLASAGAGRGYVSDQSALWDDIESKIGRMRAQSPTRAMGDVYRRHSERIDEYVQAFRAHDRQVGAVFALGNTVAGLELFDHPRTLASLLPKLIRSYALDAIEREADRRAAYALPRREDAAEFLRRICEEARFEARPSVGLGSDVRISGPGLVGGALVHDDTLMHLSAFRTAQAENERTGARGSGNGGGGARFVRWDQRRRG